VAQVVGPEFKPQYRGGGGELTEKT
jgi:hypothetical protein